MMCTGWLTNPASTARWSWAGVQSITPHDLRHSCASLAVSAGVDVLALQRMLGHTSAKITLDTYADPSDDDLDAVAVTLHSRSSRENVAKMWSRGTDERS
jgi:integrase